MRTLFVLKTFALAFVFTVNARCAYAQEKLPVVNIELKPGEALPLAYFDNIPNSRLDMPVNNVLRHLNRQHIGNEGDSFRTVAHIQNQGKSFLLLRFYVGYSQVQGYMLLPEKNGQPVAEQSIILGNATTEEESKFVTYSWLVPDEQGIPEWFIWQGTFRTDGISSHIYVWRRWNGQQWTDHYDEQGEVVLEQYQLTIPQVK